MLPGAISMTMRGEELHLLPDRAVLWPSASTLLVADPHFGKAATFRAAGIFVPEETTAAMLSRLDALLRATRATRLVFLGDFLHAREGRHPATLESIEAWRARQARVDMLLVRGNHDRRAGDPPQSLRIECVESPYSQDPFAFAHHPTPLDGSYVLAGHLHPGARLRGAGRERERVPCFWFGAEIAVLPAFGEFTGLADVRAREGDRIWVTTGTDVIELSSTGGAPSGRAEIRARQR
jgi:DNA ligase-associated metallophosphoesterase